MKTTLKIVLQLLIASTFSTYLSGAEATVLRLWTFQSGVSENLRLENAYGSRAYFSDKKGRPAGAEIVALKESDQAEIVFWSRRRDRAMTQGQLEPGEFTQRFRREVQEKKNGKLVDVDWSGEREPEFYGIYTSASWCGPCRQFTPRLVHYYNTFKATYSDQFEIVLCSWDKSRPEMLKYMEEEEMPWYGNWKFRQSRFWRKFQGSGIPCLVIVDRNGFVLSHSYNSEGYVGARATLSDLTKLLVYASREPSDRLSVPTPGIDMARLRDAIDERKAWAQAEGSGMSVTLAHSPQGMLGEMTDPEAPELQFKLAVSISKRGTVESVSLIGEDNPRLDELLYKALLLWQFLPEVESDGTVCGSNAVLPIRLRLKKEFLISSDANLAQADSINSVSPVEP